MLSKESATAYKIGLIKLSVDAGRRLFMLGAAGKAVSAAPKMALGANGMALDAIGLGIPGTGLTGVAKGVNSVNNYATNIAKWKHYRMQRVAGAGAAKSAANTYVASKVTKYKSPMVKVNRAKSLDKGLTALNSPVSKVLSANGKSGTIDKAKAMYGNASKWAGDLYSGAKEAVRYYK